MFYVSCFFLCCFRSVWCTISSLPHALRENYKSPLDVIVLYQLAEQSAKTVSFTGARGVTIYIVYVHIFIYICISVCIISSIIGYNILMIMMISIILYTHADMHGLRR